VLHLVLGSLSKYLHVPSGKLQSDHAGCISNLKHLVTAFYQNVIFVFSLFQCPLALMLPSPPPLHSPGVTFLTGCEAMEFVETGYRRKESPNLPVSLLMVLHDLRVECKKSME